METTTIHPAEAYLRNEQNSTSLYVRIAGQRRRLFINRNENVIGIIAPRKRKSGYIFTDWASIEKIYYPSSSPEDAADIGKKQVLKYQKLARLATHTNDWLRKIANADLLWCEPRENGDMAAGFSKEYRNCGNGYYYLLINDEYMIGYDID